MLGAAVAQTGFVALVAVAAGRDGLAGGRASAAQPTMAAFGLGPVARGALAMMMLVLPMI
jgi:hypothetical protein